MGIHLLIIEAENRFRKNLYRHLQAKGFTVHKINPDDAVDEVMLSGDIDVILLGVDGLGKKGLELIRPIRDVSPNTEIITINDPEQMDLSIEGMKRGVFDDFMVPLDIDRLTTRIRDAAERRGRST